MSKLFGVGRATAQTLIKPLIRFRLWEVLTSSNGPP